MDKLKKIKPIYIEIFSLLLCNLCAINIIIDTLSYTLNQRLIYTIATLVLSLVLFYIRKNKIKYIVAAARERELNVGEYIFELLSGDSDAYEILESYLEVADN